MGFRGVLKGVGWGTLFLLLILAGALSGVYYLWSHRSAQVAGRIAGLVNERVLGPETRLSIARVSGNPLQTVTLYDVELHRHDEAGVWHRVVRAPEVRATYSLGGLLGTGKFEGRIEVLRPEVRIERLADSTFALPTFHKGSGGGAPVEISDIEIRDGNVFVEAFKKGVSIRDMNLSGGIRLEGGTTKIDVRRGVLLLDSPADTLMNARGTLRLSGDRIFFEPLHVWTSTSEFEVSGPLGLVKNGALALDLAIERLSMDELNRFQKVSPPLKPGGAVRGHVTLSKSDGPLEVEWNANGIVGPDSVSVFSGHGTIQNHEFHGQDMLVRSGPAEAQGTADISLHDEKLYRIDMQVQGFDLSGPPLWPLKGKLPPTDLGGHVIITGRGFGTGVTDLDFDVDAGPGRIDLLRIEGGKALFHILPDQTFVVDSAEVVSGGGLLHARGRFAPDGDIAIDGDAQHFAIEAMSGYWKDVPMSGLADLTGKITGRTLTPQFFATGKLSPFTIADITSDSVAVLSAQGDLMPVIVFDTVVATDSLRLVGQPLEDVTLAMHIAPKEVIFHDAVGRLDSLRFHGYGEMRQSGREQQDLVVPHFTVQAGGHEWKNTGDLHAILSKNAFELLPAGLASDGSELSVSLKTLLKGETSFSLESRDFDLALLESFSARKPLRGRADISAQIHGPQGALDGRLDMEVRHLHAGADSLSLLRAGIDVTGPVWNVRELDVASDGGHARVTGKLDWGGSLEEATTWLRARDTKKLSGVALDLSVQADSLTLPRLAGRPDTLFSGVIEGHAQVKGTLGMPDIEATVSARKGNVALVPFDRIAGNVIYHEGVLTVSGGEFVRGKTTIDAAGYLPLELGLRWEKPALPEGPMRFTLSADKADLALVSELLPLVVGGASGTFKGLVVVGGTPRHPRASGRVTIENASMRPLARSEVFHSGSADISISEEGGIRLERLEAKQGKKGSFTATGWFRSLRNFEFQVHVRDGIIHQVESFDARIDGDFLAHPDSTTIPGELRPRLSGTAVAKEVIIFQEFGLAPARPMEQTPWLFDIQATVPNRLYVRNRSADLELGSDDPIQILYDGGPLWLFGGTLNVLRGEYAAPQINARFNITSGTITMVAVAGEDPQIDITAETRVPRLAQSEQGKSSILTVTVHLTGRLTAPVVTLESDDPDLSQSDIMQLLTYGRLTQEAQTAFTPAGLRNSVGNSVLVTQFLQLQFRDLLPGMGSAGVTIEPAATGETSGLTVRVSQVVAPGLLLEYSQGLSLGAGQEIGLEYRVSRNFFLRGGVVRDRILEQAVGDEYNLDFKFKLEY